MKSCTVYLMFVFALTGCGSGGGGSVKGLAQGACDCWQEIKTIQNSSAKADKADECFRVTQRALSDLRDMGVQKDWTDEQVNQAQREFDSVYDNCK